MSRDRILVIARGHLGDLIGALPALRDLRRAAPGARITVIVNEYVQGALEGCPFVDDVIYGFSYTRRDAAQRLLRQASLICRIAGRYDAAIGLRMSPPISPLLALASGAHIRAGYHQPGIFGRLLTHNIGLQPPGLSNRVANLMPLRALGIETDPAYPRLDWIPPQVTEQTTTLLAGHGLRPGIPFAVFQASCHWGCNEWRSDKWAALGDRLVERHGLKIVVTGAGEPFERRKYEQIRGLMTREPVSLLGRTSLPQLFEVVGRATLVVGTDSALTQIALAQRTPSVILFGIEPIEANGPLPHEVGVLLEPVQHWEGPALAPAPNPHCRFGGSSCQTAFCRENVSMQRTGVEEVSQRVDRLLSRSASVGARATTAARGGSS